MLLGASARRRSSHFGGHTELIPGLLGSWELADNLSTTNVIDQLENNHGTCTTNTNNLSVAGGLFGQNQMQFNTSDYISVNGLIPYISWDKAFSVEIWSWYSGSDYIAFGNAHTAGSQGISAYTSSNRFYFMAKDSSGNYYVYGTNTTLNVGLNHFVLTYDGNGLPGGWATGAKGYLNTIDNSVLNASSGVTGDFTPPVVDIGKYRTYPSTGKISVTRFWEGRELSQANVTTLNNSGAGLQY